MNFIKALKVEKAYRKAVKDAIAASEKEGVVVLENGTEIRTASIPVRTPEQIEALKSLKKTGIIAGGVFATIVGGSIVGKRAYDKRVKEEEPLLPETEDDPYLITDESDSDTTVTTED